MQKIIPKYAKILNVQKYAILSTSILSTSILQYFNTSILQHFNTSILQYFK